MRGAESRLESVRLKSESAQELRDELEKVRAELREARTLIEVMGQSRFWKLRNAWWAAKGRLKSLWERSSGNSGSLETIWTVPRRPATPARGAASPHFAGKRVLFVLPVMDRGGGANVVFSEARAMAEMGVDVRVVNLREFESTFRASYADPDVPVTFAAPSDLPKLARGFDAVVATANRSVEWLTPLAGRESGPVLGYYIQDFEPYFYPAGSEGFAHALASYTRIPGLVRFAKTEWNAREVKTRCHVSCEVVGPSFDTTLFYPRGGRPAAPPLRIAAMIRPSSPRRQPELTLRAFDELQKKYGRAVELHLFGVREEDPAFRRMPRAFPHRLLGVLDGEGLARLFNEVHVFADLSSYQAMGLTAMEAMACGAAVLVPEAGGASSFAVDGRNALVVDTRTLEPCVAALSRLLEEPGLAGRLGRQAAEDVARHVPAQAAVRVLECLFGGPDIVSTSRAT